MLYFSSIQVAEGRAREAVQQRLHGPYADHQWLWRWFPAEPGSARDFLFRRHEAGGLAAYDVVSHRPPIAQDDGCWRVRTRDYAPALAVGDRLRFELRANPTVRHGHDGKSRRHDVVMNAKKKLLTQHGLARWSDWSNAQQSLGDKPALHDLTQQACAQWLARRGERHGFALVEPEALLVGACGQHQEWHRHDALRFTSIDLAGQLTVTDAQVFIETLGRGIGGARAFGCGLLLVRRPR